MTAKERFEAQAAEWDAAGRPAARLTGGTDLMVVRCWVYSDGGRREGVSEALEAFITASEKAQPSGWLESVMHVRGSCRACSETYRVENLAVCTHCYGTYCYRCKAGQVVAANGNAACGCGGELVG